MTRAQQIVARLLETDDLKRFLMVLDPNLHPETFTIRSSGADITADVHTGFMVKAELHNPDDDEYQDLKQIDRFNVAEYGQWLGRPLANGDEADILDIGYWMRNGYYEPPVEDHRQIARGEREL